MGTPHAIKDKLCREFGLFRGGVQARFPTEHFEVDEEVEYRIFMVNEDDQNGGNARGHPLPKFLKNLMSKRTSLNSPVGIVIGKIFREIGSGIWGT